MWRPGDFSNAPEKDRSAENGRAMYDESKPISARTIIRHSNPIWYIVQ